MNLLFGLAISCATALFVYMVYRFIPNQAWEAIPEPYLKWKETVARIVAILIGMVIFATNFGAYGPRLGLDGGVYVPAVETVEVETGKMWDDAEEDRTGEADERLAEPPIRADITDAKEEEEPEQEE